MKSLFSAETIRSRSPRLLENKGERIPYNPTLPSSGKSTVPSWLRSHTQDVKKQTRQSALGVLQKVQQVTRGASRRILDGSLRTLARVLLAFVIHTAPHPCRSTGIIGAPSRRKLPCYTSNRTRTISTSPPKPTLNQEHTCISPREESRAINKNTGR